MHQQQQLFVFLAVSQSNAEGVRICRRWPWRYVVPPSVSARGTVGGGGWGRLNQLGGNTMWLKQLETYYEFEASSNANKGEPRQNGASSPGHHSSCDVSINTYTFVERWSLGMLSLKILNSTYLADWAHIGWNQNNVKLFWKALSVFQSDLLYLQLVSLLRRMGGASFPLKGYFL